MAELSANNGTPSPNICLYVCIPTTRFRYSDQSQSERMHDISKSRNQSAPQKKTHQDEREKGREARPKQPHPTRMEGATNQPTTTTGRYTQSAAQFSRQPKETREDRQQSSPNNFPPAHCTLGQYCGKHKTDFPTFVALWTAGASQSASCGMGGSLRHCRRHPSGSCSRSS